MSGEKLMISPKPPKGDDGYKIFSVRIREETLARLEKVAAATGRSRNELVGLFLEYALDHSEVEGQPKQEDAAGTGS